MEKRQPIATFHLEGRCSIQLSYERSLKTLANLRMKLQPQPFGLSPALNGRNANEVDTSFVYDFPQSRATGVATNARVKREGARHKIHRLSDLTGDGSAHAGGAGWAIDVKPGLSKVPLGLQ